MGRPSCATWACSWPPPPSSQSFLRKTESLSRQRRRARWAAEQQRQAAAEKAPVTYIVKASSIVKDVIDKQTSTNVDAIDEKMTKYQRKH